MDPWNAAGEFAPAVVRFVDEDGTVTERIASPDPLLAAQEPATPVAASHDDPPELTSDGLPVNSPQAPAPRPTPQPRPAPSQPIVRDGDGTMGYGHGTPPPGGMKMV